MTQRPNPDELLKHVKEEESRANRGKLTVFFGAAPGVGKTYAMLEAARSERDLARDVVVGLVETHGRYDTAALLIGLELLPRKKIPYKGIVLEEFDVDAALKRRPGILLVDEIAHTNAEGSRHPKRWQDIEELLDAGLDVYTTLNVQHLESLNDIVAQITGVVVRETVPDSVLARADEVRIIDLPPDELIERLRAGQVFVPEQAKRAVDHFFQKGNLIALRELALRQTAERVDEQMHVYKATHGIERAWPVAERLLVGVSPSPASARLVRAARRMASGLRCEWLAAYVETPAALRFAAADRDRLAHNLRLAEQLGAEVVTLSGLRAAEEMLRFARTRNVTKIVVGRPTLPRWREVLRPSFLDEIVRKSQGIDVYVISGEGKEAAARVEGRPARGQTPLASYAAAASIVGIAAAFAFFLFGRSELADVAMTFLLAIVLVAMRFGYGPSILAAILSVATFDYIFVPPYNTLSVSDARHIVTFVVMFVVAIVISNLTTRIREQADAARRREQRTANLYTMTRELARARGAEPLLEAAARHLSDLFASSVAVFLPMDGHLAPAVTSPPSFVADEKDRAVVEWVWQHEQPAGMSTDTLPSAKALYLPLRASRGKLGVLGVMPVDPRRFVDSDQRQLVETFASQIAGALERVRLAEEAQRAQLEIETERMRSSLLSSVSHDLRTPLAVVTGAASTLLEDEAKLDTAARRDLLETIHEETRRLARVVSNLLDMTRLVSGALRVTKEWQPLEEVIGSALGRVEDHLGERKVDVRLPEDLPLVPFDAVLLEQVLINLLENAAKYTPEGQPIEISAHAEDRRVTVEVADRGPGIPRADAEHVFEKFYRLPRDGSQPRGAGLGLAICRGVVEAHGGKIWVEEREGGGAAFRFTLPIEGTPPAVAA